MAPGRAVCGLCIEYSIHYHDCTNIVLYHFHFFLLTLLWTNPVAPEIWQGFRTSDFRYTLVHQRIQIIRFWIAEGSHVSAFCASDLWFHISWISLRFSRIKYNNLPGSFNSLCLLTLDSIDLSVHCIPSGWLIQHLIPVLVWSPSHNGQFLSYHLPSQSLLRANHARDEVYQTHLQLYWEQRLQV